jgi:hypothetical protein
MKERMREVFLEVPDGFGYQSSTHKKRRMSLPDTGTITVPRLSLRT